MPEQPLDIVKKLWENSSPVQVIAPHERNKLTIELSNRLQQFFQPGESYYYIFNISTAEFDYVSPGITQVLGYDPSVVTLRFLFDKIFPEDQVYYANTEKKVTDFFSNLPKDKKYKYKIRQPLRIRHADGHYVQILHQVMIIELTEGGNILRSLGIHSDISFLTPSPKPSFSILGFDGEPSFTNIKVENELLQLDELLTAREKQILILIMNGMVNKEIAGHLRITKETVDKHRKNMLVKTGCKNSGELITKAIRNGWV